MVHVNNHPAESGNVLSLVEFPFCIDVTSVTQFVHDVNNLRTCVFNPNPQYIDLAKKRKNSVFMSKKNEVAYIDNGFCVTVDCQQYICTVRSSRCHLLTDGNIRCPPCDLYRGVLRAILHRSEKQCASTPRSKRSGTNYRYMIAIFNAHN